MPNDPANSEALQAERATQSAQAVKEQAVRQLLQVLDPHPQDAKLSYRQVLERLGTVMTRELQQTPAEGSPSPPAPATEPDTDPDTDPDTEEDTPDATP